MFEQFGTVSSAQVLSDRDTGRSRGFGFVEMANDDEAQAAIEALDGRDHDGRRLTVNEARPRTSGGAAGGVATVAAEEEAVAIGTAEAVTATNTDPLALRPGSGPRAAYVHVPFCAHKCGYCDFASLAGSDHLADRYLSALEREIAMALKEPQHVDTIFVGGGTPTRLDPAQLGRLTALIGRWFPLAQGGEWTVEANPGTLDEEKVAILAEAGVNRLSLGAQSFQQPLLTALERNHGPDEVPRAVELVRPRIDRWSLDLIFGIPGSTLADCEADIDAALALLPSHLSCYGLVYEKGTNLWRQLQAGPGRRRRRGGGAGDVRDGDRPARQRRSADVRDLQLRPSRDTSRGTTWFTGPTTPISGSAWVPRAMSRECAR